MKPFGKLYIKLPCAFIKTFDIAIYHALRYRIGLVKIGLNKNISLLRHSSGNLGAIGFMENCNEIIVTAPYQ